MIRGSILLKNPNWESLYSRNFFTKQINPNFIIKSDGITPHILGYISNTLLDGDGEKMSPNLITRWSEELKLGTLPLNLNHDHQHVNSVIGHFVDSEIHRSNNDLWLLGISKVDDSREDVKQIINQIQLGTKLGLSVEGSPNKSGKAFEMQKDVKVWTDVKLLGAAIVTNPSCDQCRTLGVVKKGVR